MYKPRLLTMVRAKSLMCRMRCEHLWALCTAHGRPCRMRLPSAEAIRVHCVISCTHIRVILIFFYRRTEYDSIGLDSRDDSHMDPDYVHSLYARLFTYTRKVYTFNLDPFSHSDIACMSLCLRSYSTCNALYIISFEERSGSAPGSTVGTTALVCQAR